MSDTQDQNEIYEKTLLMKFNKDRNKTFKETLEDVKSISKMYNIPIYYFIISKDRSGYYNYSLHYSFYINEMINSGKVESYNIKNEIKDNMLYVTIDVKLKDGKDFSYTNYDTIDNKDNINKKVIMLQKKTFISMIKFLFPDLYAKHNFINLIVQSTDTPVKAYQQSNMQVKQQNTQNTQNTQNVSSNDKNSQTQQNVQTNKQVYSSQNAQQNQQSNQSAQKANTEQSDIAAKYRSIFDGLRINNNIDKSVFNKIIQDGINNVLGGKKPETEIDFQKLLVYVSNATSDIND